MKGDEKEWALRLAEGGNVIQRRSAVNAVSNMAV
jgi:hypothetical protein